MATKFKIEHDFPDISLEKFIAHLNDPKLNSMLESGLSFDERKMVKKSETDEGIEWRFKVKKLKGIPDALKKIVKGDSFSWQETSRFVRSENCIYWEIFSENKLLKFHGDGTFRLKPLSRGCSRTIEGNIFVDIPFVGKMLESLIVNELVKIYEIEPSILSKFYATVS